MLYDVTSSRTFYLFPLCFMIYNWSTLTLRSIFYDLDNKGIKFTNGGLRFFLFLFFIFIFILFYFPIFLFLEQLGLGLEVIGHTVTSVTIWWCGYNIGHKTWENVVEVSRTNNVIQYGYHMLTSCSTYGHLG